MRLITLSRRNVKELIRDPLSLSFGLGFPIVLLLLLSAIQANIPVELFEINQLAPGVAVFGLSFMSLFSALLLAKDRTSALLLRLYTTPLTAADFLLAYILPMIPVALAQIAVCYLVAVCLGMTVSVHTLTGLLLMLPAILLFLAIGLLCGSLLNEKQVGGLCGALLTNLAAWLSGTWFDLHLVGGAFEKIAYALPFVHAVELERAALSGDYAHVFPHLWWVLGYAVLLLVIAVVVFTRKMKQN